MRSLIVVLACCCLPLASSQSPSKRSGAGIGAGAFPVSFTHASAWFFHQGDSSRKTLPLLVYFEGTAGWHNQHTDFKWELNQSPAKIEMAVGKTNILILYWPEADDAVIQGTKFNLTTSNVFVVVGIDGSKPLVTPLGVHDLSFAPDDVPSIALLKQNPDVWAALTGNDPKQHSAYHGVGPQEEVMALDNEGLRLLTTGNAGAERQGCEVFRRAALQGYAGSQYRLGYCYESGRGVDQNFSTANQWYEKAANQGYVDAQYKLGHSYRVGRGVPIDLAVAFEWYKKAANNGDPEAMHNVGWMYATGQGVNADSEKAYGWFLKAAMNGETNAQFEIARRLRDGDGVTKDPVASYGWLLVLRAQQKNFPPNEWEKVSGAIQSLGAEIDRPAMTRAEQQAQGWLAAIAKHEMDAFGRN